MDFMDGGLLFDVEAFYSPAAPLLRDSFRLR